ncbi:MAG: hypothetical protein O3A46_12135 [Candidatus Poribacteria bacterium]|nr:hypothetical protein [Candidatus Poribacteria bacterium]
MNTTTSFIDQGAKTQPRRLVVAAKLSIAFVWKLLVAAFMCQNPIFAVFAVGWVYRLAQRGVVKQWWKRSGGKERDGSFRAYMESHESTLDAATFPNWFAAQRWVERIRAESGWWSRVKRTPGILTRSLRANFVVGLKAMLNVWAFTLPAGILWTFAWYAGWTNSFTKGYETAFVGPTTGLLGVALFIVAMMYVPFAQLRQASTGDWRRFLEFRFVWRLLRLKPLTVVWVAAAFSLATLPVMILKTLPGFLPQMNESFINLTDAEALAFLNKYWFRTSVFVFAVFAWLKLYVARRYADSIWDGLRSGAVSMEELSPNEREAIEGLGGVEPIARGAARDRPSGDGGWRAHSADRGVGRSGNDLVQPCRADIRHGVFELS